MSKMILVWAGAALVSFAIGYPIIESKRRTVITEIVTEALAAPELLVMDQKALVGHEALPRDTYSAVSTSAGVASGVEFSLLCVDDYDKRISGMLMRNTGSEMTLEDGSWAEEIISDPQVAQICPALFRARAEGKAKIDNPNAAKH